MFGYEVLQQYEWLRMLYTYSRVKAVVKYIVWTVLDIHHYDVAFILMMMYTNDDTNKPYDVALTWWWTSIILYDASKLWWYDDEHVDEAYLLMIHCLMMSDECSNAKFWSSRQLASFLCPIYIHCYLVENDDDLRQDMTCWCQQRASVLMSRLTSRMMSGEQQNFGRVDMQHWWWPAGMNSRRWAEKMTSFDVSEISCVTVNCIVKASLSCLWG